MGWGDLAREAMNKALEAYKASVVIAERMQNLLESFKAMEGRLSTNQHDFEQRLREMESRVARLEGRVDAALAEAYTTILRSGGVGIPEASEVQSVGEGKPRSRSPRALRR
jgi:predicted  nucleic acid-binding Zn-ribbon protein